MKNTFVKYIKKNQFLPNMDTKEAVIEQLKNVQDPEIGMDIWTLELVYDVSVEEDMAKIKMTFTTPMCPYGPMLVEEVKAKVSEVEAVKKVDVEVTFDPPWKPSEELRATLGV